MIKKDILKDGKSGGQGKSRNVMQKVNDKISSSTPHLGETNAKTLMAYTTIKPGDLE
jgi:hypothetical protein